MTLKPRHIRGFLSLAPPALGECCHRSLARRAVAVRRRAILVGAERQRPNPRRSYGSGAGLEDAADNPSKSSSFHSPEEREADAMADGTLDGQVGGRPYLQWTGHNARLP